MHRYFAAAVLGSLLGVMVSYVSFRDDLACIARSYSTATSRLAEYSRYKKDNWDTIAEMSDFLNQYKKSKELSQQGRYLATERWLKINLEDWILIGALVGPVTLYVFRATPDLVVKA